VPLATAVGAATSVWLTAWVRLKALAPAYKSEAVGRAEALAPVTAEARAAGASSLRAIAAGLNARGIVTAQGGLWSAMQVKRVLERV
jgi:hypothetical protein